MPHLLSDETTAIGLCAEGAMLSDAGQLDAALDRYREAVRLAPALLDLHLILANAQRLANQPLAERATLRHALRVAERADAAAEYRLGKALVDAGAGADAVSCFRRVCGAFPGDPSARAALATALREAQLPEEAWVEVHRAITRAPTDAAVLATAALIRHDLSDFAGALHWCEESLAVRPDHASTRMTRGYLRHLLGDQQGGWRDFEARALPEPGTAARAWHGEPLDGRSIAVLGEQGAGDQFQFVRFLRHPRLQAATRVIVTCQPACVALLRDAGFDAMRRGALPATDFYVPMLSLPLRLQAGEGWRHDLMTDAYLSLSAPVPPRESRALRVGLVWAGNPAHRNDAVRSIASSQLHELLRTHQNVQFVSMQHDIARDDLPTGLVTMDTPVDWLDTARHLCTLDVLISVDTGIAHLSAAMGLPTWILLPHVPDWRWGATGNVTAWYPTARLFRQSAAGHWSSVITRVSAALGELTTRAR